MPRPDPSRVLEALCAYWQTAALVAAIELDLFTILGSRPLTAARLANRCGADAPRLRRLCDTLVWLGFLRKDADRYRARADAAAYLDTRSPDALGQVHRFFNGPPMTTAFAGLAATVRGASTAASGQRASAPWRVFADAATPLRRLLAREIADELQARRLAGGRILDVGAGASPLGIELLRRNRDATLVVQDAPAVVRIALRDARAAGIADRVRTLPGDALALAWGGPYDLVLLVNVLDYFEPAGRASILQRARAALAPGGVVAVHAPLLSPGRAAPPEAVAYDLMLLALSPAGGASTFADLRRLLRNAGLVGVTRSGTLPLVLAQAPLGPPGPSRTVATRTSARGAGVPGSRRRGASRR